MIDVDRAILVLTEFSDVLGKLELSALVDGGLNGRPGKGQHALICTSRLANCAVSSPNRTSSKALAMVRSLMKILPKLMYVVRTNVPVCRLFSQVTFSPPKGWQ